MFPQFFSGGRFSMFRQLLVCLLLVAFVSAQTAPPATPAPAGQPAAPAANAPDAQPPAPIVGPDDVIITIKNFCTDSSLTGDVCKTSITKAQFEKLADALQPNMSPAMRRQLATAYARMLTMSTEAEKRGLDKTPHFDEATHFARMQILSQDLGKALQSDSGNVSDQDIQDYYQKNTANFEMATFIRIFVPHTKRVETPAATTAKKTGTAAKSDSDNTAKTTPKPPVKKLSPEEQQKAGEEAMKAEAARLRTRLNAGEDPEKLEKAAFTAGGLPGTPPPTKMEKVRRTSLPPSHQAVMELKEGEVSEVISDPSGNYIYKMVSKETMTIDSAKTEIKNTISAQRYRESMQKFQNNADLNDAYFGPARGPGMPMPPRGGPKPPTKADPDHD
jgi:hypothetical protein